MFEKEDGSIYCGKNVPGLGMIGCSPNWKCRNCKACQKQKYNNKNNNNNNFVKKVTNNTSDKQYECRNCKCYSTITGNMCGKRGRISGNIIRCKSHCENCTRCDSPNNNNNGLNNGEEEEEDKYKVVQPKEPYDINNIIINNISKKDDYIIMNDFRLFMRFILFLFQTILKQDIISHILLHI